MKKKKFSYNKETKNCSKKNSINLKKHDRRNSKISQVTFLALLISNVPIKQ